MAKLWRKYEVGRYRLGALFNPDIKRHEAVVCWRDDRGPHRHRLGVFSEAEGRVALDTWVGRIEAVKGRDDITVEMIWDLYVADRKKDGKLTGVFDDNWKALKPRFGAMVVTDITDDVCRDYGRERMERGRIITRKGEKGEIETVRYPIGVGTVWTELLRLRSAINWAWQRNRLKGLSVKPHIWIPRKPAPKMRTLSVDEFLRLREGCLGTPHLRLFMLLALTTAGRTEAILQLRWEKVNFDAWTIDLREERGVVDPLSKAARKGRALLPMTEEARTALLLAKEGALTDHVIEWDGAPVKKIRKAFHAAVQRAGLGTHVPDPTRKGKTKFVTDVTPHTLRHTALTWLDEDGIPMERISKLAAHGSPDVTRKIYVKSSVEVLRPAALAIERRIQQLPAQPTLVVDGETTT